MKFKVEIMAMLLLAGACATNNPEDTLTKKLDSMLAAEFKADEPGGAVLIIKGDKTLFSKSYGLADLETGEKITGNTLFNLGSVSKTFVSNGILILHENGMLSVNDDIGRYFPGFINKEIAGSVKIVNLLSHTSGLPDNRNIDENSDFFLTAKDEENFAPVMQAEKLNFLPGERFEYSNPAFNGLALIIEQVSGQKWQQFIADSIFKPAGMSTSTITDGPHPESGVAHGYDYAYGKYIESDYGEFPTFPAAGNGGVWSSVNELIMYEKAIRENLFLGSELTDRSRTIYRPDNWSDTVQPLIGYSWFIGEEEVLDVKNDLGVRLVYHTGDQGGFRAFYFAVPEKNILYVGLFNRPPENMNKIILTGLSLLKESNWFD